MRRDFRMAMALAAVLGLGACVQARYHKTETSEVQASTGSLNPNKGVVISVPADGVVNDKSYAGSGQVVAQQTAAAFSRYSLRVEIAASQLSKPEDLLAVARAANAGYLVVPTISLWLHRNTALSARPSRVGVRLAVIDIDTGREVRSTLLEGTSATGWAGGQLFVGGTSPEALLPPLIDAYVAELYGAKAAVSQP